MIRGGKRAKYIVVRFWRVSWLIFKVETLFPPSFEGTPGIFFLHSFLDVIGECRDALGLY